MKNEWEEIDRLMKELVEFHKNQLLKCGRRLVPHLTSEDVLQPNDFRELEFNPYFRYEEGILAGLQTAQIALQALRKEGKEVL